MIIHADELANLVLKKSLRECSIEELQQLTEQYPYFGPAHFLLTKKLQEDRSPQFEPQLQNTSLYFQNRVWLHHLLNDHNGPGVVIEKKELPVTIEQKQTAEPITVETKEQEAIAATSEEKRVEQTEPSIDVPTGQPESMAATFANENNEVPLAPEPQQEEITQQEMIAETGDEKIIIEQTPPPIEIPTEQPESMAATFANENNEVPLAPEPKQEEIKEPVPAETQMLRIEPVTADTPLIFEPYHTVDYFASQGIKYKEEEKPKDRFSAQLKSFTEWLKTMKKIPVSEIIAASDTGNEKKVEQMAEFSLAERHVITEAMAEVWKKQGNKARAEDIYNKLSLLDPSKSSYFAAKIEELKKTS